MKKITLRFDEKTRLEDVFNFAQKCVVDFVENDHQHCLYTNQIRRCFIKKTKAGNLIIYVGKATE